MNQQFEKKILVVIGLVFVVLLSFFVGRSQRQNIDLQTPLGVEISSISDKDFAQFWKVWNVLEEKYVGATTTPNQEKIWGATKGLVDSLGDPYTVYFPPEEEKEFEDDISGVFGGVGMEVGEKDKVIVVISPLKNSPAEKVGMKAGDRILKIDDTVTSGMSVDKAVKLIRGEVGTKVRLTVLPEGSTSPVERTITREIINMPTIETEIKDGVFIIRFFSFNATSPSLFKQAIREFVQAKTNKLVLDLRGNPGGYLEAAVDIASIFLPSGKVVVTEDFGKNGPPRIYRSKGYNIFNSNLKMAILVDGGSASASEILAGALKEHGVAKLVGAKTFGKGSVQELVKITSNTSLKVTIARWLTPNGINISKEGLVPDFEVKHIEGKDVQLDKAIEILK